MSTGHGRSGRTSRQDPFDRILASLHEAALDPLKWPAATGLIEEACGITGNCLAVCRGPGMTREEISFARMCFGGQRDEELEREYFRDHWSRDERLPRVRWMPAGELVPTGDLYTEEEKSVSSTYELMGGTDMQRGFHVRLEGPDQSQVVWALGECTDTRGWSSTHIERITRLLPHLRHFASVRQVLADAQALGRSLVELLDGSHCGVIQLNHSGRILATNDHAHSLLVKRDGLVDRRGFLRALNRAENVELERLLAGALPPLGIQASGGSMTIRRPSRRTGLAVHVNPVGGREWDFRARQAAVLVLVVDPERQVDIDPGIVAASLGLTAAESRLATMLAAGHTLRDIAAVTGRTEGTVRWHLKQIFRKQGLSRQAELVRRVLSLDGLPGNPSSTASSPPDH